MNRVIFLDKDGTLIPDIPYNVDPAQISLLPGAAEGLRALYAAGYKIIIITNQSGVARGLFTEVDLIGVEARLRDLLAEEGVPLAGFYYCPHHVAGTRPEYAIACECRKPEPGLILKAAQDYDVDLSESWMIGDILNDVQAGRRAGCRTILVDNGNETEWQITPQRIPHHTVQDLREAARVILMEDASGLASLAQAVSLRNASTG